MQTTNTFLITVQDNDTLACKPETKSFTAPDKETAIKQAIEFYIDFFDTAEDDIEILNCVELA